MVRAPDDKIPHRICYEEDCYSDIAISEKILSEPV